MIIEPDEGGGGEINAFCEGAGGTFSGSGGGGVEGEGPSFRIDVKSELELESFSSLGVVC